MKAFYFLSLCCVIVITTGCKKETQTQHLPKSNTLFISKMITAYGYKDAVFYTRTDRFTYNNKNQVATYTYQITGNDDERVGFNLTYDNEGKLNEIDKFYDYSVNGLFRVGFQHAKYNYFANRIVAQLITDGGAADSIVFKQNSKKLVDTMDRDGRFIAYKYDNNNNVIDFQDHRSQFGGEIIYTRDTKINPIAAISKNNIFFMFQLWDFIDGSPNNALRMGIMAGSYTFNDLGYPVSCNRSDKNGDYTKTSFFYTRNE